MTYCIGNLSDIAIQEACYYSVSSGAIHVDSNESLLSHHIYEQNISQHTPAGYPVMQLALTAGNMVSPLVLDLQKGGWCVFNLSKMLFVCLLVDHQFRCALVNSMSLSTSLNMFDENGNCQYCFTAKCPSYASSTLLCRIDSRALTLTLVHCSPHEALD